MSEQTSFLQDFKKILLNYLQAKFKLYKIIAYEKIAKFSAVVFSSLIIILVVSLILFFFSMSAAFYFSELLNSNTLGFLLVAGIYLFLFILLLIFRKILIEKPVTNMVIRLMMEEKQND